MSGEFALIARYFTRPSRRVAAVDLGVGDDCALLRAAPGMHLAVSTDMLVEGRHFLPTVAPERLGHKALAVNLSDLAACGAQPLAFTLALALPRADDSFLAPFSQGLLALADEHGIELVGGDTTAGPLNICITVFGQVPPGQALLRSGAQAGDEIWVSGVLGDARLALEVFRGRVALSGESFEQARRAMELPQPRVALGLALRGGEGVAGGGPRRAAGGSEPEHVPAQPPGERRVRHGYRALLDVHDLMGGQVQHVRAVRPERLVVLLGGQRVPAELRVLDQRRTRRGRQDVAEGDPAGRLRRAEVHQPGDRRVEGVDRRPDPPAPEVLQQRDATGPRRRRRSGVEDPGRRQVRTVHHRGVRTVHDTGDHGRHPTDPSAQQAL